MERERPSLQNTQTDDKLHQQFKHLQRQWDSIKHPKPRTLRRISSQPSTNIVTALRLLENSPRSLMSSLHHCRSPSSEEETAWKVSHRDFAIEEIIRERKAAIQTGKLKGRRLFEAEKDVTEVGFGGRDEICSVLNNGLFEESEVRSVFSYDSDDENENYGSYVALSPFHCQLSSCNSSIPISSSSSSSSSLCGDRVDQKQLAMAAQEERGFGRDVDGDRARWVVVMGLFLIALIGIISIRSFSGGHGVAEVILVPT